VSRRVGLGTAVAKRKNPFTAPAGNRTPIDKPVASSLTERPGFLFYALFARTS